MFRFLSNFDIFRRVPKDLTEATKLGGCVSILTLIILSALTVLEIQSLLRVSHRTRIDISHREDEEFRVNLNITFPAISCDWISINLLDVIGRRDTNISSNTLHKHNLHGHYVANRIVHYNQPYEEHDDMEVALQIFANQNAVQELTPDTYDKAIREHRVVIVNFFAPWCPYCVALAPIYNEAAAEVSKSISPSHDILFATVNCVNPENYELCQQQHIQVFPTLRVYRDGENNPKPHVHMHEEYRGPRAAHDITQFAIKTLKEVRERKDESHPVHEKSLREYSSFGCIISGHIKVSRVPGSIVFMPMAEGHNFHSEAINMSHVINHMSFGQHPFTGQRLPRKLRGNVPKDLGGVYANKDDDSHATLFLSLSGHVTHEHYIKIVPSIFVPMQGKQIETYEYTINSNLYEMPDEDIPQIKLVWDIWPMEVVNIESRKPMIEGLCQMLGFLGGVFSFFMSLAWFLQGTWRRLIKAQEAKLS